MAPSPELQDKYLNIISHEADRLEKLTRSLMVLNDLDERKRMMNIRKFDINDVIKNTANTFEVICSKKNIDLELLLSGRELFVEADMEQIQQVLYNLLDNAIKFSNDNSSINIETSSVKNDKGFRFCEGSWSRNPQGQPVQGVGQILQDRYLPRKRPGRYRTWAFYCERDHQSS